MRRNYIFITVGIIIILAIASFFLLLNQKQSNEENAQIREQNISNNGQPDEFTQPIPTSIPNPNLNNFFIYANNNEIDKLIALMTEETVIIDQRREFRGIENITKWLQDEIIGATYTIINETLIDENQKYFEIEYTHPNVSVIALGFYDIKMQDNKITEALMSYKVKRN